MHPDTAKTMRWILQAGGQVTAPLLAFWRFTYRGGDREARRRLATFESRNWMKRHGTERYPLFGVTAEGAGMCGAAEIEVSCQPSRTPKVTAKHDASTAAILQRAVDLGVIASWWSRGEFSQTNRSKEMGQKEPDALAELLLQAGKTVLVGVELEASKKGGSLRKGHSNWSSTAADAASRLNKPLEVLLDGQTRPIHQTLFIGLTDSLSRGMHAKAVEAFAAHAKRLEALGESVVSHQPLWLTGDRLQMKLSREPRSVSLVLLDPLVDPLAGALADL